MGDKNPKKGKKPKKGMAAPVPNLEEKPVPELITKKKGDTYR